MKSSIIFQFCELLDDIFNYDVNDVVKRFAHDVYYQICKGIGVKKIDINYRALYNALSRYSKDVYGLCRIKEKLSFIKNDKSEDEFNDIIYFIKNNSGLMLETYNPHINKKIAYLVYHLTCLKPFQLKELDTNKLDSYQQEFYYSHFNEIIVYYIVLAIFYSLRTKDNKKIEHELIGETARYFIRSLTFRKLNRSSLELLFETFIYRVE